MRRHLTEGQSLGAMSFYGAISPLWFAAQIKKAPIQETFLFGGEGGIDSGFALTPAGRLRCAAASNSAEAELSNEGFSPMLPNP